MSYDTLSDVSYDIIKTVCVVTNSQKKSCHKSYESIKCKVNVEWVQCLKVSFNSLYKWYSWLDIFILHLFMCLVEDLLIFLPAMLYRVGDI